MRLDRIPGRKTSAILGKIFENIVKESKYTIVADKHFHDTRKATVVDGSFGAQYFTVEELPRFHFTVWMASISKIGSGRYAWNYFVFGAHENDWSKFKPSAVQCKVTGRIMLDEDLNPLPDECQSDFNHDDLFTYIKHEYYLARYRELTYADYNLKFVSRGTAKRYVRRHDREIENRKKKEQKLANTLIEGCIKNLKAIDNIERIALVEWSNSSPRYYFFISGNFEVEMVPNTSYSVFDFGNATKANYLSTYSIDDCVMYVETSEFDEKMESIKNNKWFMGTITIIK